MEKVIARGPHYGPFFQNWVFDLRSVQVHGVRKEVLEANAALEILVLIGGLYLEIVIIVVRQEKPRDKESRAQFILQEEHCDLC